MFVKMLALVAVLGQFWLSLVNGCLFYVLFTVKLDDR